MPGPTQPGTRIGAWKQQAGHGFRRGQPVYLQSAGRYALATLDTGFDGLVGSVALNQFELVNSGELDGLTVVPNTIYSLSGVAGTLVASTTYPVMKALSTDTALLVSANAGTEGTDVVLGFTVSVPPIADGVPKANSSGTVDPGWLRGALLETDSGATGRAVLAAEHPAEAIEALQLDARNAIFTYTGDLLTGYADPYGTKVFTYDGGNNLISITGTGKYVSKVFTYTGGQLTAITVP